MALYRMAESMNSHPTMNPQVARFNMIEQQIRTWQVLDKHVLALLDRLDRRIFVPDAYQSLAFSDIEIPIGHGEHMLAPKVDARLLQDLELQAHENVLEIGTGTGYLTALLAMSCAHVTSVECHADFIPVARQRLEKNGISNFHMAHSQGLPDNAQGAPFDAILLGGSVATVPTGLLQLLKPTGRMLAVIGEEPMMQTTLVQRQADGSSHDHILWDVVIPRLHGFTEKTAFHF